MKNDVRTHTLRKERRPVHSSKITKVFWIIQGAALLYFYLNGATLFGLIAIALAINMFHQLFAEKIIDRLSPKEPLRRPSTLEDVTARHMAKLPQLESLLSDITGLRKKMASWRTSPAFILMLLGCPFLIISLVMSNGNKQLQHTIGYGALIITPIAILTILMAAPFVLKLIKYLRLRIHVWLDLSLRSVEHLKDYVQLLQEKKVQNLTTTKAVIENIRNENHIHGNDSDRDIFSDKHLSGLNQIRYRYMLYAYAIPLLVFFAISAYLNTGISIIAIILAIVCYKKLTPILLTAYRTKIKEDAFERIAAHFQLSYKKSGAFTMEETSDHRVLPPYCKAFYEDGFSGKHNERSLSFQEIILLLERAPKKQKTNKHSYFARKIIKNLSEYTLHNLRYNRQSYYKGLICTIPLQKKLSGQTIIKTKKVLSNISAPFKKVGLLNKNMRDFYEAYSTDQVEARYILDPHFIEQLVTLSANINAEDLIISFKDQEMVIISHNDGDHFEVGNLFTAIEPECFEPLIRDIQNYLGIIDILHLEKTGDYNAP